MKTAEKKNNKLSFSLSIKAGLALMACFLVAAGLVIAVIALTNLVFTDFFSNNPIVVILLAFVAATLVGATALVIVMKYSTKQLDEVREILDKIAGGDYSEKLPLPKPKSFLYDVAVDFNKMVDRLNATAVLQNDFANNFSHEFKTPMVSVKGYAELLEKEKNLSEEERKKYLKIIIDEADRLTNLASSTLLISKLDSEKSLEGVVPVRADEQIEECIILLDKAFQDKNLETEINLVPFTVRANADMLKEVWINLLSNAIKYGRENGKITVSSVITQDCYMVSVTDDGIGMNEKTQSHIFDKYYQGDRSHRKKGTGLGLPIAKRIIELTGGNITVKSAPEEGSTFTVIFPKHN